MRLEFYPLEKLKKEIVEIIGRYLDLNSYRIFFFGSRVAGKGNERSDIDIGIEGAEPVPMEIFFKIKDEIDTIPTLYKIEIVDFKKAPSDFREVAFQCIEEFANNDKT
ncbi:MAG: nucleotidyltransferase domain-containing protein [Nitrospinae bacterium]|nr:nucleotidyltransferase domain-containing protein [Nitrospinota bacterium]MBI3813202.1 nucleotidyltransferase domain-containing protein [Nitrospinota bacterium]